MPSFAGVADISHQSDDNDQVNHKINTSVTSTQMIVCGANDFFFANKITSFPTFWTSLDEIEFQEEKKFNKVHCEAFYVLFIHKQLNGTF